MVPQQYALLSVRIQQKPNSASEMVVNLSPPTTAAGMGTNAPNGARVAGDERRSSRATERSGRPGISTDPDRHDLLYKPSPGSEGKLG